MPIDGDAKPLSKEAQLARGERRYTRKVASPKRWQAIADAKQGPCKACMRPPPNQLHHVISRAQGGADTESNIVALCAGCHQLVTNRDQATIRRFLGALTDAEHAYALEHGGESFFERAYGLKYVRGDEA